MLLGLDKRFLFVATPKCASTTVEFALKPWSELALYKTGLGKHMPYRRAMRVCAPLLAVAKVSPEALFRFAVVRDPVDWVVSWYNYLARPQIARGTGSARESRSTRNVPFEVFANTILREEKEMPPWARIGQQNLMFTDQHGKFGLDYLIALPRLDSELQAVRNALGLERATRAVKRRNTSPPVFSASDVPAALAARLRSHFARDTELFGQAAEGRFGTPEEVVQRKRSAAGPRKAAAPGRSPTRKGSRRAP